MKRAFLFLLCMMLAGAVEACPKHEAVAKHSVARRVGARRHRCVAAPVQVRRQARPVPVCKAVVQPPRPEKRKSFCRRVPGWAWAGVGVVAGLVIENNIHDHAGAVIVTTVVNTCVPHGKTKKPHRKKC